MSIIDTLIADRSQADLLELEALLDKAKAEQLTEAELSRWNQACSRGSYNYTDLNRVGRAVIYLARRLEEWGHLVTITPKTDWKETDQPTPEDFSAYLLNVVELRAVLPLRPDTPRVPTGMQGLTLGEANAIEQVLIHLEQVIDTMISTLPQCGEALCGGYYL